ncbi:hypothetical protein K6025_05340 [Ehrlichia sp. JZT12]
MLFAITLMFVTGFLIHKCICNIEERRNAMSNHVIDELSVIPATSGTCNYVNRESSRREVNKLSTVIVELQEEKKANVVVLPPIEEEVMEEKREYVPSVVCLESVVPVSYKLARTSSPITVYDDNSLQK